MMVRVVWAELVVGLVLIVTSCAVVGRPRCQANRLLMATAGAALFVGVVAVVAGVGGLTAA